MKNIGFKKEEYLRKALIATALVAVFGVLLAIIPANTALAAGNTRFGSAGYTPMMDSDFNIGVYIESTDGLPIGDYSLTLFYDPNMITYKGGAVSGGDGSCVVAGRSPDGQGTMHMLTFHANQMGDTSISVAAAVILDSTGVNMELNPLPIAPIQIQKAVTRMPSSLKVNGKEIPELSSDWKEYTFSVPYAEDFTVEAPEGYEISVDAPVPKVGRNNIYVTLTTPGADPLELVLHANMEEKQEEVLPADNPDSGNPSEEANSEGGAGEGGEMTSEAGSDTTGLETVELIEPFSEQPTEESVERLPFPPNNNIEFEFGPNDWIYPAACGVGALVLFVIILLIMNGASVNEGEGVTSSSKGAGSGSVSAGSKDIDSELEDEELIEWDMESEPSKKEAPKKEETLKKKDEPVKKEARKKEEAPKKKEETAKKEHRKKEEYINNEKPVATKNIADFEDEEDEDEGLIFAPLDFDESPKKPEVKHVEVQKKPVDHEFVEQEEVKDTTGESAMIEVLDTAALDAKAVDTKVPDIKEAPVPSDPTALGDEVLKGSYNTLILDPEELDEKLDEMQKELNEAQKELAQSVGMITGEDSKVHQGEEELEDWDDEDFIDLDKEISDRKPN